MDSRCTEGIRKVSSCSALPDQDPDDDFDPVEGSGNIFRDFADPDADLKQAKSILAARIIAVLDDRELTVRRAAEVTGFAAADFSRIRNASLRRFTLDRLMKMLCTLDRELQVTLQIDRRSASEAAIVPLA